MNDNADKVDVDVASESVGDLGGAVQGVGQLVGIGYVPKVTGVKPALLLLLLVSPITRVDRGHSNMTSYQI